jgi:cytochrome P450
MQDGWGDGQVVDVFDLLAEATMAAMIEILFGTSVDRVEGRALRDALTGAVEALESLPLPVVKGADRIPLPANRRFDKARARLDSLLMPMVAERRARPTSDGDLLTSMVHARNANGDAMSDRQVRDEALSIFRGHKGTGTALSWIWYLLSRHPAAERRMLEEIDSTIGNGLPTVEDLARLQFCRMVMAESMRLFPPVWLIARRAVTEHHVGGYRIPVGSAVITSPYVIHRDPHVHPEPLRFDPDRFAPERHSGWHPFAYFPFGGGPKRCVGDDFATFETLLLLATVGRGWRLNLAPDRRVEPAPKATLKPRDGLHMILERRASG